MSEVTVYIDQSVALPDNDLYQHRFEIESESSNRIYIVSQHKVKRHWCCSCPGWKRYRKCKHLRELGLPAYEEAHEPAIEKY